MFIEMCVRMIGCSLGIGAVCACDLHMDSVVFPDVVNESSADESTKIQIYTDTGHIVMQAWIGGDGPHWFVLDTGNQNTTIFAGMAQKLGLETTYLGEMGGAGSGSLTVEQANDVQVGIGDSGAGLKFNDPMVTVLPDEAMLPPFGDKQVVGFLGASLIERFVTSIDYEHDKLELIAHDSYQLPDDAQIMELKLAFGFPYFEGSLIPIVLGEEAESVQGSFLLDLGDSASVGIEYEQAHAAGLIGIDDPAQISEGIGQGIDGVRFERRTTPAKSIVLGGRSMDEDSVIFSTTPGGGPPIPNLVGYVGSGAFVGKIVTLDYVGERLILTQTD